MNLDDAPIAGLDRLETPAPRPEFWDDLHRALLADAASPTENAEPEMVDVATHHASGARSHRRAYAVAVAATVLAVGALSAIVIARDRAPEPNAPSAIPAPITHPAVPRPTSTAVPTTGETPSTIPTAPPSVSLIRPVLDMPDCRPTWAREPAPSQLENLFGRHSSVSVPVQVFGDPANPYDQPFIIVERFFADQRVDASVGPAPGRTSFNHESGRSSAQWLLPDGSEVYMNARDVPDDIMVAIAQALQPRDPSADVPGVDLPNPPLPLQLIDEVNGPITLSDATLSACEISPAVTVTVGVLAGRPLARYAALIDHAPPLPVARQMDDGRTLIAFGTRSVDMTGVLDNVREGTEAEWLEMLAQPSPLDGNYIETPNGPVYGNPD